jgi:pimeloyl-ACP methyl ester carboxylesterase
MGAGEPLIILHGLYGSSDNWLSLGRALSEYHQVYLLDQRNHGRSPHTEKHNYFQMQADLLAFMDEQGIEKANLLGHSMGGKTALFFAVTHPERVHKLVVVDIAPKPYPMLTETSAPTLHHLNIINALYNLDTDSIRSLKEADSILAERIPDQKTRQFLLKNLKRDKHGSFKWLLNLHTLRNELPAILDGLDPAKDNHDQRVHDYPVLFLKGALSGYIQAADYQDILRIFPQAMIKTIEGAGHWLHAEKRETFLQVVRRFLAHADVDEQ